MLDFTVSFFITIINLLVLYLLFKRFLFKPVTQFMDKRIKKVKDDLADAAMMKEKAEDSVKRYDALLADADAEAERHVKEGRDRAKEEADAILRSSQAEASEIRRRSEESAKRELARAFEALTSETARIATEAAGRLMGRSASEADMLAAEAIVRELGAARER